MAKDTGKADTRRPRRLIEVAFPLAQVSKEAAREKSIRHGHISTLHIWWARRPLVACRAVTFATLVPDPDDPNCPPEFQEAVERVVSRSAEPDAHGQPRQDTLRNRLVDFVARISTWGASKDPVMEGARELVRVANGGKAPKTLDPFAGGGALPLEALRLGCEAYASDLNPVAVLLEKCTLEYPQRFRGGPQGKENYQPQLLESERAVQRRLNDERSGESVLAADLRYWGNWVLERAKEELGQYYPSGLNGETPVAYLWARTASCPNPACGIEMPLIRQYWLARKDKKRIALKPGSKGPGKPVEFSIVDVEPDEDWPTNGTTRRGNTTCIACGQTADKDYVKREHVAGNAGTVMLAVVSVRKGITGKSYAVSNVTDETAAGAVKNALEGISRDLVPDERTSTVSRYMGPSLWGFETWADYFSPRQLLALTTFARLVRDARPQILAATGDADYADAIATYLALAVDRLADRLSTVCRWDPVSSGGSGAVMNTFARQAIPMTWDYAETNPLSEMTGGWPGAIEWIRKVIDALPAQMSPGHAYDQDAAMSANRHARLDAVITDPPYYDAVPYADISDFFYVWLKRMLNEVHPTLFGTPLTPKSAELVQQPTRHGGTKEKARIWYQDGMASAFTAIHGAVGDDGLFVVVFAHPTTEAWEALLAGVLRSGFRVTAAWPIQTEMATRMRARNSAVLSASVWLVCRPRDRAEVGEWGQVQLELEQRLPERLQELWDQGVRGADLFLAGIGPGMEVFSRYERVERLDGSTVGVGEFLDQHVQPAIVRFAAEALTGADGATRFYYIWRMGHANAVLPSGEAIKLAQGTGVELDTVTRHGLLEKRGGKYTLRDRRRALDERQPDRFAVTDESGRRPTAIDALHALLHFYNASGAGAAAQHINRAGLLGDEQPWRLAQALASVLERVGGDEMRECQELLGARPAIEEAAKRAGGVQRRLIR